MTRPWSQRIREYFPGALVILLLLAARSSLADHYVVPTGSMEWTLEPGDRVVADKRAFGLRVPFTSFELIPGESPARGDLVVFDAPDNGMRLIKRVVAVSGDHVAVRDGHVWINGAPLEAGAEFERYGSRVAHLNLGFGGGPDVPPTEVPRGQVLVLGDARGNSRDGRFFGFVREDEIYARGVGVYYRASRGLVWLPL